MSLIEDLDMVLGHRSLLLAELAEVFSGCGLLVTEERLCESLSGLLLELTVRQRRIVQRALQDLVRRIPQDVRQSGQVGPEVVRQALLRISPVTARRGHGGTMQELVDAIVDALPMADLIQEPEEEGSEENQAELVKRLEEVPRISAGRSSIGEPEAGREGLPEPYRVVRSVPSNVLRQQEKMKKRGVSSRLFPDISFGVMTRPRKHAR